MRPNLNNKSETFIKYLLLIIAPFVSFLYALRSIKSSSSYTVFFVICILFGLSFTPEFGGTMDSIYYYNFFESNKYNSLGTYLDGFREYLTFDSGRKDYYIDTAVFLISRVTHNYHILFGFFAVVFTFFYLKSFKFLTEDEKFDTSWQAYFLAFLFTFSNPIFNINGVRFWTAAWIGVFCVFQIFKNRNNRYFLLALLIPFFHASFFIFIFLLIIAFFLTKQDRVWTVLFAISFFVSNLSVEIIGSVVNSLPGVFQNFAASYTSEESLQERSDARERLSWFIVPFLYLVKIYINVIIFLFIRERKLLLSNYKTSDLYTFLLVWMTFVNFTMAVPSMGVRFVMLAYPVIAYMWLVAMRDKYTWVLKIMPIVFFLHIYGLLVRTGAVTDVYFYFANLFYIVYNSLST